MQQQKKDNSEERGEGYLASVADLMAGLLFVFIIALCLQMILTNNEKAKAEEQKNLYEMMLREAEEKKMKALLAERNAAKALEETRRLKSRAEKQKNLYERMLREAEEQKTKALLAESKAVRALEETRRIKDRLAGNNEARTRLLRAIRQDLISSFRIFPEIDYANGILRLSEGEITFPTGKSVLGNNQAGRVENVASVVNEHLVCYIPAYMTSANCMATNPGRHTVDAIFIEGHTDNQPYGGDTTGSKNRALSTERANVVYDIIMSYRKELGQYRNERGETLFSLSGYGQERPLPGHAHKLPTDDAANRRIELRFIMTPPSGELK